MRPALTIALLLTCGAAGADECTAIRFQRGTSGAVVTGTAYSYPTPMTCYTLETGAGQTATVEIVESGGDDTAFNISGEVDNQFAYTFRTEAKTYQIDVYRTFARQPPVPFKMAVSVQ